MPIFEGLRFLLIQHGLSIRDVYLGEFGPTATPSPLTTDDRNSISRMVMGLEYGPAAGAILRASAEWWHFSNFDDTWVYHLGAVFTF